MPAPAATGKSAGGKKSKAAAKAAAATAKSQAAAAAAAADAAAADAAANEARCDTSGADAAQEMLLAVVEGHPERLQDSLHLLLRTAQAHAQEVKTKCFVISSCPDSVSVISSVALSCRMVARIFWSAPISLWHVYPGIFPCMLASSHAGIAA